MPEKEWGKWSGAGKAKKAEVVVVVAEVELRGDEHKVEP